MLRRIAIFILFICVSIVSYFLIFSKETKTKNPISSELIMKKMHYYKDVIPEYSIVFFVTADCPLCKNYRSLIQSLNDTITGLKGWSLFVFREDAVGEINNDSIPDFNYQFVKKDPVDPSGEIAKVFGATVTPEVFILNKKCEILYQGAIDNWSYETGRHRLAATEHYLWDAINQIRRGEKIKIPVTKPVGCYIE